MFNQPKGSHHEKIEHFESCDRYVFDWDICSAKKGWSQFDTRNDASYYGMWVNPFDLEIITYTEGDIIKYTEMTEAEFCTELRSMANYNDENGLDFIGIDTLCRVEANVQFIAMGLGNLLHKSVRV